jgi:hypothetical protein
MQYSSVLPWKCQTVRWCLVGLTGLLLNNPLVHAQNFPMPSNFAATLAPTETVSPWLPDLPAVDAPKQEMTALPEDPLNSPYPIPWTWILKTQADFEARQATGLRYFRTPALVSPDGQYAAYSRVQIEATPDLPTSRVTSVLFVENLQTGQLQIIRVESPFGNHPLTSPEFETMPGLISVTIPVSWSAKSDRLLSRQFEGLLSSSDASDELTSVLMGWNRYEPDRVLFQAGALGEDNWPMWSVALTGETAMVSKPESITFGQPQTRSWTGAQALR